MELETQKERSLVPPKGERTLEVAGTSSLYCKIIKWVPGRQYMLKKLK